MNTTTSNSLENKIAVITGGCSGIGKAIVKALLEHGVSVVNADIKSDDKQVIPNEKSFFSKTDITNVEEVQHLYRFVTEEIGKPQILICNAGKGIHEKLSEGDPEKWLKVIDLNLMGTLRILRSFLPDLLTNEISDVVFISSIAANHMYKYGGIYSATKAAIESVAETLRLESKEKIRVTVISPGVVNSDFFQNMETGQLDVEQIGLGALEPSDVADALIFALTRGNHQTINNITLRPIRQLF